MSDYLKYRTLPKCRMVQVIEDFIFWHGANKYTIPEGFVFDGFSNPRLFWRILPSSYGPRVLDPGCKHDFFYRTHDILKDKADKFLEFEVNQNGVGKTGARMIYYGVKYGGKKAWREGPKKPLVGLWGKYAEIEACKILNDKVG